MYLCFIYINININRWYTFDILEENKFLFRILSYIVFLFPFINMRYTETPVNNP